jgi:Flp pilus assembly protein TadG
MKVSGAGGHGVDMGRVNTVLDKIRSWGKRVSSGNQGGSLIEFALVLPVLMIAVTGMAATAIALHNLLVLTNAVNIGAQQLSFSRGQTTDPCATAYTAINKAAPGMASSITLTFVIDGASFSGNSCTGGATDMVQGATAEVTATYPCTVVYYGTILSACTLKAQLTEYIQ